MSQKKVIEVDVVVNGEEQIEDVGKSLDKVDKSAKGVETQSKKTSKSLKDVGENGGAIALLDSVTGGLATKIRDAAEASKLFNVSLKATKTALIGIGIGVFVVALGAIVAYWEEIVDFITGANKHLEEQRILLENNAKLLEAQVKSIKAEKALRVARGKGIDDLLLKEKALLKARIANRKEVFRTRKAELELAAQRFNEITATEEFLQLFGVDARTQEDLDKIKELKVAAFEAKAAVKEAEKDLLDLENDIFDSNAIVIGSTSEKVIEKAKPKEEEQVDRPRNLETLQTQKATEVQIFSDAEKLKTQAVIDSLIEQERLRKEAAAEERRIAQAEAEYKIQTAANVLGALQGLAEQGSAGAKAIAVAQAVVSTYQGINKALAETTDFTPTQSLRFLNAALVGVAGFANVAKILSTDSSGATVPTGIGGGGVGNQPQAPSFNVVGQSGVNQLADTLNQEQQPIQAFVVGSQVTTQQELDNNIVNTANIG